jgi:polysaccharide export outer membrane protein
MESEKLIRTRWEKIGMRNRLCNLFLVPVLGLLAFGGCAHDPDAAPEAALAGESPAPATEVTATPLPADPAPPSGAAAGSPELVVEAVTVPKGGPVQEAVRVQTEAIMPADVPPNVVMDGAVTDGAPPALPTDEEIMAQYRIGPTDVLDFKSFDDATLNTPVTVRHDGYVSLPWIADLKLGDLTREEATAKVREAYQALYFEAEVSLQITEAMSKTYTVAGEVTRPAEFPYLKPITLLDAIVAAGGLRVNQRGGDSFVGGQGQLVKAVIIRGEGENRTSTEYDLRFMERPGVHATQTPVLPGDTVVVPEGLNLVYVLGAVGRPGIQPITARMTLLQVMAAANGFNESQGRLTNVVLMREVKLIDVKAILKNGGDFIMEPGDIIYVPRKRLVTLGEFIQRSTDLVSPIMGVMSQAMGLYTQAYEVFYTDNRMDLLYNSDDSDQLLTNLELLDAIRDIGDIAGELD